MRNSAAVLGSVDLLQVHKANVAVLSAQDLLSLLSGLAAELGIPHLGVSASDPATCDAALEAGIFDHIQCPVNVGSPELAAWTARHCRETTIVANRPYGSGGLLADGWSHRDLLAYTLDHIGDGVVLTGTTSAQHLRQTCEAFKEIVESRLPGRRSPYVKGLPGGCPQPSREAPGAPLQQLRDVFVTDLPLTPHSGAVTSDFPR